MKVKFLIFILLLVAVAIVYYFLSTDRNRDTVLIGIVDANQVIVRPYRQALRRRRLKG